MITKVFNGNFWERTTLQTIGLCIRLGHNDEMCPAHIGKPSGFTTNIVTVLDIEGIQDVSVQFCKCEHRIGLQWEERNQFIKYRFFPATAMRPRTVATFKVLDIFVALTHEGKINGYDFYKSLVSLTDGIGGSDIKVRNNISRLSYVKNKTLLPASL